MSTAIVSKTKVALGAIKPSTLSIVFDPEIPAGSTARAEMSPEEGFIQPKLFVVDTDPEVQAEVYALLDGAEHMLLELDEDSHAEVDVDEEYGDLLTKRLVLVGRTKTDTTAQRKIALYYTAGLFDYR
jgi:hypothetical protein